MSGEELDDVLAGVARLPLGVKLTPARIAAGMAVNRYLDRFLVPAKWVLAILALALVGVAALASSLPRAAAIGAAVGLALVWTLLVVGHGLVRRLIWRLAVPRALRRVVGRYGGDWEGMLQDAGIPTGPLSLALWLWQAARHPNGVRGRVEEVWFGLRREAPELARELAREAAEDGSGRREGPR